MSRLKLAMLCLIATACADSPSAPSLSPAPSDLASRAADGASSITWRRVRGFDNPRGLAFRSDGSLFVAEAGTGGSNQTIGQCTQVPSPVGPYSGGPTARISRITPGGERVTVASGLPSSINLFGDIQGVADVALVGNTVYALLGGAGCSHGNASVPNGIIRVNADGSWQVAANFSAYYPTQPIGNPDPSDFEPDGVLFDMVADAKGNIATFYFVEANGGAVYAATTAGVIGRIRDLSGDRAGFSTPTAIGARGRALFVANFGQFTLSGNERVRRVAPGAPLDVATGLDAILGVAFDARGRLYVLQTATSAGFFPGAGQVVRVDEAGNQTVVQAGLEFPTALTFGPDGALYVSNRGFGFAPGEGEVVRIPLR